MQQSSVATLTRRRTALLHGVARGISGIDLQEQQKHAIVARLASMRRDATCQIDAQSRPFGVSSIMLCAIPVVSAFRYVGTAWAEKDSDFSEFTPVIVSSGLLFALTILFLRYKGTSEVSQLFSWKYIWLSLAAAPSGLLACLQVVVFRYLNPTVAMALMNSSIVMLVILQYVTLRQLPGTAQFISVLTASSILVGYTFSSMGDVDGDQNFVIGVPLVLLCAFLDASSDLLWELVVTKMQIDEDSPEEVARCFAAAEGFTLLINVLLLLSFDCRNVAEKGAFYGWSHAVAAATSGTMVVEDILVSVCILTHGALLVNLACSVDVAFVYVLEIVFLRTQDFQAANMFCLAGLVGAVSIYNLIATEVQDAALAARLDALDAACAACTEAVVEGAESRNPRFQRRVSTGDMDRVMAHYDAL